MVQVAEIESLGAYLRKEREERKVTLEEVSSVTRINVKLLTFLEEDNYKELPNLVFVKGYLNAYANYLGLDLKEVLSRFNDKFNLKEKRKAPLAPKKISKKSLVSVKPIPKRFYWYLLVCASIAVVIIVSTFGKKSEIPLEVIEATQPEVITEVEEVAVKPTISPQILNIKTSKPVWLKIQIDNDPIYSKHMVSDKELNLEGKKEIKIYISDRSAVNLTHNGKFLDYTGNAPLPLYLSLN
jgi:cytoskeleton protein RodZ